MESYNTKEFKYATLTYKPEDEKNIAELGNYIDACAPKVMNFFEIDKLPRKAEIIILPTKTEFDKIFREKHGFDEKKNVADWSVGFVDQNGMVFYLSLNDYKNTAHKFDKKHYKEAFEHYKKTLVHEFVHFVNLECFNRIRKCGRPAKYLSEGIATYLSGQKDNKKIIFDYSIDDIMHFDYNKSCYDGWYLVTKYLVENYDKQFVLSLFESNREANDFLQNELYEKAKEFYLNDKSTIVKRKNK